jgi:phosphate transport system substrate-binding protein
MNAKEKAAVKAKHGTEAVEIPVARDGVAVYVNEANPIQELTIEQIRDIYRGKITNWSQVGGQDARIIIYSRENNSGTYAFFKEHVLQDRDFSPLSQSLPGTAAVVNAVTRDKKGIGYGGSAYAKGLKFCAVKATDKDKAYEPTEQNIVSGKYPVSRDLYFYTRSDAAVGVKNFIEWVRGPDGQKIVSSVGYFPVKINAAGHK